MLDKILNIIQENGNKEKIYGRKCIIKEIKKGDCEIFLNKNHIQGFSNSTIYLGCYYYNRLVGVMTFLKEKENRWNLNRFATDIDYICNGVASKLFKFFINEYKPKEIKSFLDLRWGENRDNIYLKLGFKEIEREKPDYYYTNGHNERYHKFGFRKQILSKKYGLPLTMTENEMTEKLGYWKIWNCGLIKYVWKNAVEL